MSDAAPRDGRRSRTRAVRDLPRPTTRRARCLRLPESEPLRLDCDQLLAPISIAYKTYGTLNAAKSNAILICHALTGDQYVASEHPVTGKPGWWETHGRPRQADRHRPLLRHLPQHPRRLHGLDRARPRINPTTGKPYGLDFPVITIGDMVDAQVRLIDHLGIDQLFCVIGGSMGGMQVLEWAARHKDRVFTAVPIATAAWHSSQNIAFHEVGRQAVMADPDWCGGRLPRARQGAAQRPRRGAHGRAHHLPVGGGAAAQVRPQPAGPRRQARFSFNADFQVESYLRHQGSTFVDRFDANSYLYITRAMDYFDLAAEHGDVLANAFRGTKTRFCVVSFTSDWLYPTRESREIVQALNAVAANVRFVEIESDKGHDAFLLEEPELFATMRGFLNAAARQARA